MCGLLGFISKKGNPNAVLKARDVLNFGLYYNRLRGVDALGMMKVWGQNYETEIIKDVGDPAKLFKRADFVKFHHWAEDRRYFLMHNRLGTKGKNTKENAHPYRKTKPGTAKESVVLAHNGTIHYIHDSHKWPGKTDSEQIAAMIAEGMPLNELDARLSGAYALAWYDSEDGTMNFLRDNQRPFSFIDTDDAIWYGSEIYAVAAALDRCNIKINNLWKSKPLVHYRWDPDSVKLEEIALPPLEPVYSKSPSAGTGGHTTSIEGTGDTAEEAVEEVDLPDVAYVQPQVMPNYGYPKSGGTHSASASVLPFPQPSWRERRNNSPSGQKKPKMGMVEEAFGFDVGSTAMFCITDYKVTTQGQVGIEGQLVEFGDNLAPQLHPKVMIEGMTTIGIERIDKSNCLWTGVVKQIWKENGKERYVFQLSDLKMESDETDVFQLLTRALPVTVKKQTAIDTLFSKGSVITYARFKPSLCIQCNGHNSFVDVVLATDEILLGWNCSLCNSHVGVMTDSMEEQKKVTPPWNNFSANTPDTTPTIVKAETPDVKHGDAPLTRREKSELQKSGAICKKCDYCTYWFVKDMLHDITKDEVKLYFCGQCWKEVISDEVKMSRIFEEVKSLEVRAVERLMREDADDPHFKPENSTIH